jgi:hypothetical protein
MAASNALSPTLLYHADITAGALKLQESRIIADLLLRDLDEDGWRAAITSRNVLQTRSVKTAQRLALLIRGRLSLMGPELWRLVRDGDAVTATHATLAAAVKHSRLLGDFLDQAVREQYRIYSPALVRSVWTHFIRDCAGRDPGVESWSESTVERLRQSVFQILAQAGYIDNVRSMKLQPVRIATPVVRYLEAHHEAYVLRCIRADG